MFNQNVFRLAACAVVLALATASSAAFAAEGGACAVRAIGPQGQAGAVIGHLDANGKCLTKPAAAHAAAAPKADKSADDGSLEASAQCRDLSFSYSKRRESACTKHGGVLEWLAAQ